MCVSKIEYKSDEESKSSIIKIKRENKAAKNTIIIFWPCRIVRENVRYERANFRSHEWPWGHGIVGTVQNYALLSLLALRVSLHIYILRLNVDTIGIGS